MFSQKYELNMQNSKLFTIVFSAAILSTLVERATAQSLPIVLWHGMGDTCCFPFSLGGVKRFLESEIGVYVKSIEIGNSITEDFKSGYLMHPNQQDRLGLKKMDELNKIVFLECEGNHLQFTKEWFRKSLFPYLK
uniref:Palmitoyl-protein thioesterase 1 n=1 Tax=Anopheles farauti TaxID=69004 RepID=A0A182QYH0_9DIPT